MIGESFALDIGGTSLAADLGLPDQARGLVVFAQRAGRNSAQSRATASALMAKRWGALVFDLLTAEEAASDAPRAALRFDIGFLGRRLVSALDRIVDDVRLRGLSIALFGSGLGAAAALVAAAERPRLVGAVSARGGRPDLAMAVLARVKAPTLLCAGGRDLHVVKNVQQCLPLLPEGSRMLLIPGAGPAFDDPNETGSVARASAAWFHRHLASPSPFRSTSTQEQG